MMSDGDPRCQSSAHIFKVTANTLHGRTLNILSLSFKSELHTFLLNRLVSLSRNYTSLMKSENMRTNEVRTDVHDR